MPLGSVIGGLISQGGANSAAAGDSAAGGAALANSTNLANKNRADFSPFLSAGTSAISTLNALTGNGGLAPIGDQYNTYGMAPGDPKQQQTAALSKFQTSPGYTFRLQQGTNALDRSAAARGMTLSGAQQQAVSDYGQNTGSAEYANYIGQLQSIAGLGLSAAQGGSSTANGALVPGINDAYQGQVAGNALNASGANALAAGIKGGINSLASLGTYGGAWV